MSWSFSVQETTKEDAKRVFGNRLVENQLYIPANIQPVLQNAADALIDAHKDGNYVSLQSSGHANADGSWHGAVYYAGTNPIPEAVPFESAQAQPEEAVIDGGSPSADAATVAKCELCGEPMPENEQMFKYHGYSGPCPTKVEHADPA